ncbi:hypothetical protein BDN72DRAFT_878648 [Pluteus cervinus]|uniref:Uncharacterized protein n=1 Tax=Pluteus cervinus TaxID=181527 RepID=A0ACD3ATI8_9AGAR|nr:hypothetical protein BDN72DRAFT_878648 [Pluteus cervinus]
MHYPVPHEIWLHIAHYLPATNLCKLISLNSTFFELAMDCRYRQISFTYLNDHTLKSLIRLQDPAVARRVRILHVYPGFLKEVAERELRAPQPNNCLQVFKDAVKQLRPGKRKKSPLSRAFRSSEDITNILLQVLRGLPNVTDYYIVWCGLPPISRSPVPFLTAVLQSRLRKLSLEISLENIETLLGPAFAIPNLEELEVVVRIDEIRSPANQERIMFNHLGPAISCLHPTLHTLSIQAWEPLDISPLFASIQSIPSLRTLAISIPTTLPHLGNPKGLRNFLNRHSSSLQELTLRASQYGGVGMTPDGVSMDHWIREAISDAELPHLHVLDISSGLFPLATSIQCLTRFSRTISSLALTGRYHSLDDVALALNTMDGRPEHKRLHTLRLGPVSLTPQLMDLLAEKLPYIQRLELLVREVLPEDGAPALYWYDDSSDCGGSSSQGQVDYQIEEFCTAMDDRIYPQWRLKSILISIASLPDKLQYEAELMECLWKVLPVSFKDVKTGAGTVGGRVWLSTPEEFGLAVATLFWTSNLDYMRIYGILASLGVEWMSVYEVWRVDDDQRTGMGMGTGTFPLPDLD